MKKALMTLAALALLVSVPVAAQTVYVDYDREADLDSYKTFSWVNPESPDLAEESPLMHSRIKNAIEYQLTTGGLIEDTQNPDLYVTYHTNSKEQVRMQSTHMGYGGGWGWDPYWDNGMGSSTTSVHTYKKGTLIIDIWDAKTQQAVFRGSAEATVKANPEKVAKQIDNAVEKIAKKFQSMERKGK